MSFSPKSARTIYYFSITAALLIVVVGWLLGNINSLAMPGSLLVSISRLFGLVAAFAILLEVLLISRVPLIENYFDLDKIIDLHRLNGYAVLFGTVGHVIFLSYGYAAASKVGVLSQFIEFNSKNIYILLASIGTVLIFMITLLSIKVIRSKLRYEIWYFSHLFIYLAILLVFIHQISNGNDFKNQLWFKIYWITLYLVVFGLLLIYRFLRPIYILSKFKLTVIKTVKEAKDTYSIIIGGKGISKLKFLPGQYATLRFLNRKLFLEAHPYSISSIQGQTTIRFTLRIKSEYSRNLLNTAIGTKVLFDGPRGSFIPTRTNKQNVIIIACGIGIAPFMSSINALLALNKKVQLYYAVNEPSMLAFIKELDNYKNVGLSTNFCISCQGARINDELLKKCALASQDADIFICGPTNTSKLFIKKLINFGASKNSVFSEQFLI